MQSFIYQMYVFQTIVLDPKKNTKIQICNLIVTPKPLKLYKMHITPVVKMYSSSLKDEHRQVSIKVDIFPFWAIKKVFLGIQ